MFFDTENKLIPDLQEIYRDISLDKLFFSKTPATAFFKFHIKEKIYFESTFSSASQTPLFLYSVKTSPESFYISAKLYFWGASLLAGTTATLKRSMTL